MIASHYAEPLLRRLARAATLSAQPDGEAIISLREGDEFRLLDMTRGWAWGYAPDGRVGYLPSEAVAA